MRGESKDEREEEEEEARGEELGGKRGRGGGGRGGTHALTMRSFFTLLQITRTCRKRRDIFCNKTREMVCVLSLQSGLPSNTH